MPKRPKASPLGDVTLVPVASIKPYPGNPRKVRRRQSSSARRPSASSAGSSPSS